jgi:hypothetical protein
MLRTMLNVYPKHTQCVPKVTSYIYYVLCVCVRKIGTDNLDDYIEIERNFYIFRLEPIGWL